MLKTTPGRRVGYASFGLAMRVGRPHGGICLATGAQAAVFIGLHDLSGGLGW